MRNALFRAGWAAWVAWVACALLLVAGCSSSAQSPAAVEPSPVSSGASASGPGVSTGPTPGAGSGSGSATPAVPPSGPAQPPTSLPSIPGKCLSGTLSVVYPAADIPLRSACVHLGTAVNIELMAIRGTTWSAPTVSDPSVATVADQVFNGGTRHDAVTLLKPGTVTFTSVSTYGPDPHGPPSKMWTLTLTVVP